MRQTAIIVAVAMVAGLVPMAESRSGDMKVAVTPAAMAASSPSPDYVLLTAGEASSRIVVSVLPDGMRCLVRGQEVRCVQVGTHLREVLKVKGREQIALEANPWPGNEKIFAIERALDKAGFATVLIPLVTSPSRNTK